MSISKSIGSNIKKLRMKKGVTQEQLAEALFVTRQTVSNYEVGKSNPDIDTLQKIAQVLDTDLNVLLYGEQISLEKKAPQRRLLWGVLLLAVSLLVTETLWRVAEQMWQNYNVAPSYLIRLILIPLVMGIFGWVLVQAIDCFWGIRRSSHRVEQIGWVVTICLLGCNLVLILPHLIWLAVSWVKSMTASEVEMHFPNIPIYQQVSYFLVEIILHAPYVYIVAGVAIWMFFPGKDKK